jgi:hypothetical protein
MVSEGLSWRSVSSTRAMGMNELLQGPGVPGSLCPVSALIPIPRAPVPL